MTHLVTLQHTLITLLQRSTSTTTAVILPDLATLLDISNGTRTNAVVILKEQYQRMCQKAPVQTSLLQRDLTRCDGEIKKSYRYNFKIAYKCSECRASWLVDRPKRSMGFSDGTVYKVGDFSLKLEVLVKEHAEDAGEIYCRTCKKWIGTVPDDWALHFDSHSSSEIRRAWDRETVQCASM